MPSSPPSIPTPSLGALGRLIERRPLGLVFLATILAIAGAVLATTRLVLDADTNHLIAPDRPFMADFEAWLDEFGDLEAAYVVVDGHEDDDSADAAVEALVDRLASREDLPAVHGWISSEEQWRLAPRAMPETELEGLVDAARGLSLLAGPGTAGDLLDFGASTFRRLAGPDALALDDATRRALGGSATLVLGTLAAAADAFDTDAPPDPVRLGTPRPRQMLVNPGGRLRFVEIVPRKDFGSLAAIEEPLAAIRQAVDQVRDLLPDVEIGVTGKPVLQADELATSDRDMTRSAAGALVVIAILFMRVFHGWRRPLLMVITFAIAFGWTYGAATLLVGRLNLLSIVFMLVLVGVGLDYGVHVTTRWIDARRRGIRIPDALAETLHTAGRGNLFGATTSAGVFLLAIATDFGGLRELGIIAGVGLLLCVLAMNVILPALLVLEERRHPLAPIPSPAAPTAKASASTLGPGVSRVTIVVAVVATIGLGSVVASKARFQDNLLELQAVGLESVEWEHRVLEDSSSASWFAASVVDSLEDVERVVAAAAEEPAIGERRSVLDLVPRQTPKRETLLAELASTAIPSPSDADPATVTNDAIDATLLDEAARNTTRLAGLARPLDAASAEELDAIARRLRILAVASADDPDDVHRTIVAARRRGGDAARGLVAGAEATLRDALPAAVRARLVSPSGRFMVSLVPAEDVWSPEPMARFVEAIRRVDPEVTGVPVTQYESLRDMRRSFQQMALWATVLVALLVWFDFRSVRRTLVVMVVLGVGLLWTLGVVTLLGVHLNVANFFAIPILIGLGVDSAIHLLHRIDESGAARSELGATRRAVILTAVTTGIGFGSLIFARHRGLESLGVVMAVGSLCCLVATVVLLPRLATFQRPPTPPEGNR